MISFAESMIALDDLDINTTGVENLFLSAARTRVLAVDIIADENSPVAATSGMDGYAIKAADQEAGRIVMKKNDNPAGCDIKDVVESGTTIKTFTGSLMPEGADTLIPIENVTVDGDTIIINEKVPEGFAVRPVGESYKEGEVLIQKGTTLEFAQIGVLAGLGRVMIPVFMMPKVAILATGSEVLDLGVCSDNPAQIRSSNNYTLEALADQHGAKCLQLGVVGDAYEDIKQHMKDALDSTDILVTTGGVSVGDYDFVKDIIPELGATVVYKGVTIKPGQHVMVAQKGNKFIVALPGFAYSSTVTFMLYVIPLIARLKGQAYAPNIVTATLTEPFNKRTKKAEFTACNVRMSNGLYEVDFRDKRVGTSAILTNMLGSVGLLMTSETDSSIEVGQQASVMLLS
jgi:molybdopterin molybdotransferase